MEDQLLSRAVITYLAKGRSSFPRSDEEAVKALEVDAGVGDLRERVHAIVTDLMSVEVDWSTHTLSEGGDEAEREMARRHPELTSDALTALRWSFTYNWR